MAFALNGRGKQFQKKERQKDRKTERQKDEKNNKRKKEKQPLVHLINFDDLKQ